MEIDELEVQGETREMYEEISGCPEEIIYPILEGMEVTWTNAEVTKNRADSDFQRTGIPCPPRFAFSFPRGSGTGR